MEERTRELHLVNQHLVHEVQERRIGELALMAANEKLERLASIDELTQLKNRRMLDLFLLEQCQSQGGLAAPLTRSEPEGPRPSLLQTLVSEASIKIYLYLGAFFVIASAAILGAAIPELRLPILIMATLIFGGLAVAIKKKLPQPSFAKSVT